MSLSTELVKHCTSLLRLSYLDDLMTRMTGVETEVWGLRAENFPSKLIPNCSKDFLCYMGIMKEKLYASYGQVHFLTFGHENFVEDSSVSNDGLLQHMYDIYCEMVREGSESIEYNQDVYIYPIEINSDSYAYWSPIAKNTWGIRDKLDFKNFIQHNELVDWVNWKSLEDLLPRVYYPSEGEYDTETDAESESKSETETETESESESESETEEGEILDCESSTEEHYTDDEPPRKRRKYITDSDEDET